MVVLGHHSDIYKLGYVLFLNFPAYCWFRTSFRCFQTLFNSLRPRYAYMHQHDDQPLLQRLAIIWTNAGLFFIVPLGTNLIETWIKTQQFSLKSCIWKCRLQNGCHCVSASICSFANEVSWDNVTLKKCREALCRCGQFDIHDIRVLSVTWMYSECTPKIVFSKRPN